MTRIAKFLCQAENGMFVYISADDTPTSPYESWKLFVGDGKMMREIPIDDDDVTRYADGGRTRITTPEQPFFSPSPFDVEDDPTLAPWWGDMRLTPLDPNHYNIVETADGQVTITKMGCK